MLKSRAWRCLLGLSGVKIVDVDPTAHELGHDRACDPQQARPYSGAAHVVYSANPDRIAIDRDRIRSGVRPSLLRRSSHPLKVQETPEYPVDGPQDRRPDRAWTGAGRFSRRHL